MDLAFEVIADSPRMLSHLHASTGKNNTLTADIFLLHNPLTESIVSGIHCPINLSPFTFRYTCSCIGFR